MTSLRSISSVLIIIVAIGSALLSTDLSLALFPGAILALVLINQRPLVEFLTGAEFGD